MEVGARLPSLYLAHTDDSLRRYDVATIHCCAMLRRVTILSIAVILCSATFVSAQVGGSLSGIVKDPSGGVMPGVSVTATNTVARHDVHHRHRRPGPVLLSEAARRALRRDAADRGVQAAEARRHPGGRRQRAADQRDARVGRAVARRSRSPSTPSASTPSRRSSARSFRRRP